jgi:hypothetical protein
MNPNNEQNEFDLDREAEYLGDRGELAERVFQETKAQYRAEGRTYCECCGNSDVDMKDIDDVLCYDCLNPGETADRRRAEMLDELYAQNVRLRLFRPEPSERSGSTSTLSHTPAALRDVLYELSLAKEVPDADVLDEFVRRYPEHAESLTEFAILLVVNSVSGEESTEVAVDTSLVSPAVSRAMSKFQNARPEPSERSGSPSLRKD